MIEFIVSFTDSSECHLDFSTEPGPAIAPGTHFFFLSISTRLPWRQRFDIA